MTEQELKEQITAKAVEMGLNEVKTDEKEANVDEVTAETVNKSIDSDPFLEEALKMGFDPNHQGPNKKTAEQFVKDGSFFRKIDAQNKKIDDLLNVVKGLDEHTQKLQKSAIEREKIGYEKALRELQLKRQEAVEEGDVNKFHKVEAELTDLNKVKPIESFDNKPIQPSPDIQAWAKENESWFNNKPENKRLVREADGLFTLEKEDHPNLSDREILEKVKAKIEILHPERFENPNKSKPAAVVKATGLSSTTSTSGLESRLTERQLSFYKSAKAAGIKMTIQDYAKQLEINGDLRSD